MPSRKVERRVRPSTAVKVSSSAVKVVASMKGAVYTKKAVKPLHARRGRGVR